MPLRRLVLAAVSMLMTLVTEPAAAQCDSARLVDPEGAPADWFGTSVAISGDGSVVVVGSPRSRDSTGTAFVFAQQEPGGVWRVAAELTAVVSSGLGSSVAISADGSTVLVEGAAAGSGFARVYVMSETGWVHQSTLTAGDPCCSGVDDVALSADGNTAIVGSRSDGDHGAAYVFVRNGAFWQQQARLTHAVADPHTSLGSAVAMSADGCTAVVGAFDSGGVGSMGGEAYVFVREQGGWTQHARLIQSRPSPLDYYGASVAISGDGQTALVAAVSADDGGIVFIFDRDGSRWTEQVAFRGVDTPAEFGLGTDVALSYDGQTAMVGALGDDMIINHYTTSRGSTYWYERNGADWALRGPLTATGLQSRDRFGRSVALSADGLTAVVGANDAHGYEGDDEGGAAYIHSLTGADTDGDRVFDRCDNCPLEANEDQSDCDGDATGDACAIESGQADCNDDGEPDTCDLTYAIDDGSVRHALTYSGDFDVIYLNQFAVRAGAETLASIGLAWIPPTPHKVGRVLVYDDPDNDGDPRDAVLLRMGQVSEPTLGDFRRVSIAPTFVGGVGESFFIGVAFTRYSDNLGSVGVDLDTPGDRSWTRAVPAGQIDLFDLANNPPPLRSGFGALLIRAGAGPDAVCFCPADVDGDGAVGFGDVLAVIGAWLETDVIEDVNYDGIVDTLDLLAVLRAFGPCS